MEAMVITLDSQGRFVIPEGMIRYASLGDNLTIIGAGDHFEIWNNETWNIT